MRGREPARLISKPCAVLFEACRKMLCMLRVSLKDPQTGLEQALQFSIGRARDQCRFKSVINRLVIGNLVRHVRLVEFRTLQLSELDQLARSRFRKAATPVIIFRRDLELLEQIQSQLVHDLMVTHHIFSERSHVRIGRLTQSLPCSRNINNACRISDMRNLRITQLPTLRESGANPYTER